MNEQNSTVDFSSYNNTQLAKAFFSVNRVKFPKNYEAILHEIEARKSAGTWDIELSAPVSTLSPDVESFWEGSQFAFLVVLIHCLIFFGTNKIMGVSFDGTNFEEFLSTGAMSVEKISNGEVWRIFTAIFAHLGSAHFIGNMIGLWLLISLLNKYKLEEKILYIYLSSALLGNVLTLAFLPIGVVAAGCSGGVFGLAGILVVLITREKNSASSDGVKSIRKWNRKYLFTVFYIVKALFNGLYEPGINNSAHITGFFFGVVIAYFVLDDNKKQKWLLPLFLGVFISAFPLGYFLNIKIPKVNQRIVLANFELQENLKNFAIITKSYSSIVNEKSKSLSQDPVKVPEEIRAEWKSTRVKILKTIEITQGIESKMGANEETRIWLEFAQAFVSFSDVFANNITPHESIFLVAAQERLAAAKEKLMHFRKTKVEER